MIIYTLMLIKEAEMDLQDCALIVVAIGIAIHQITAWTLSQLS